jgi:3-oxoacyl-[acyl-carrier protein] reductase
MFGLNGRVALVTGAGQGVGRETALTFARQGASVVVVNDYYPERAEAVAAEVRALGARGVAAPCDVGDAASVAGMVASIERDHGGLHILVNNAGNAGPSDVDTALPDFRETGPDEWERWLRTNLYGVMNCCRASFPLMMRQGFGRIVTVISDAGRVGEARYAVYSGAKAGAAGFMRALAKAGGRYLVTANCVALGAIETPGLAKRLEDPERRRKVLSNYVIRRLGQPLDAAAAILFLSSEEAGWITGQTYPVNGGYAFNQ